MAMENNTKMENVSMTEQQAGIFLSTLQKVEKDLGEVNNIRAEIYQKFPNLKPVEAPKKEAPLVYIDEETDDILRAQFEDKKPVVSDAKTAYQEMFDASMDNLPTREEPKIMEVTPPEVTTPASTPMTQEPIVAGVPEVTTIEPVEPKPEAPVIAPVVSGGQTQAQSAPAPVQKINQVPTPPVKAPDADEPKAPAGPAAAPDSIIPDDSEAIPGVVFETTPSVEEPTPETEATVEEIKPNLEQARADYAKALYQKWQHEKNGKILGSPDAFNPETLEKLKKAYLENVTEQEAGITPKGELLNDRIAHSKEKVAFLKQEKNRFDQELLKNYPQTEIRERVGKAGRKAAEKMGYALLLGAIGVELTYKWLKSEFKGDMSDTMKKLKERFTPPEKKPWTLKRIVFGDEEVPKTKEAIDQEKADAKEKEGAFENTSETAKLSFLKKMYGNESDAKRLERWHALKTVRMQRFISPETAKWIESDGSLAPAGKHTVNNYDVASRKIHASIKGSWDNNVLNLTDDEKKKITLEDFVDRLAKAKRIS